MNLSEVNISFTSVQFSCVWLFATPWTAALQASWSITNSQSLLKFMSTESVMPSNHLILCCPLLLLPSVFPSIRVFSNELVLHIRWPKYWSFSFSISASNEHPGLFSFKMGWLDLLAVQGTLKNLLQHHSLKASFLWCSAFFIVQLSHPQMTTVDLLPDTWMLLITHSSPLRCISVRTALNGILTYSPAHSSPARVFCVCLFTEFSHQLFGVCIIVCNVSCRYWNTDCQEYQYREKNDVILWALFSFLSCFIGRCRNSPHAGLACMFFECTCGFCLPCFPCVSPEGTNEFKICPCLNSRGKFSKAKRGFIQVENSTTVLFWWELYIVKNHSLTGGKKSWKLELKWKACCSK